MTKRRPARVKRGPQSRRERSVPSSIAIKRVYDKVAAKAGVRILVDRLWPRGLSKVELKFDAWPRELAPSNELRKWYGHKPERFAEFRRRYRIELARNAAGLAALRLMIEGRAVTLLTAVRELDLSHATVLCEVLKEEKS
jgi:uncharacterized protein YeaO (DUF488 family)